MIEPQSSLDPLMLPQYRLIVIIIKLLTLESWLLLSVPLHIRLSKRIGLPKASVVLVIIIQRRHVLFLDDVSEPHLWKNLIYYSFNVTKSLLSDIGKGMRRMYLSFSAYPH